MFWVRAAFAVMLVLFLLPSNGQDRMELYTTAQRTIADLGGFCDRNPDVCEKVSASFYRLLQKLKSATNSIEDMLRETGIGAERPPQEDYSGNGAEGAPTASLNPAGLSTDTLTDEDRDHGWRGPSDL